MPPYHVILATAEGQRSLFRRHRFREVNFQVSEVDWPAPSRLSFRTLASPRKVTIFALRRASTWLSKLDLADWGNRYFFVGQWLGPNNRN